MIKQRIFVLAAGLLAASVALQAQDGVTFQIFGRSGGIEIRALDEGFGNRVVKGKPFSAVEERHFIQILGDGTRLETKQANRIYRDSQGRTRIEEADGRPPVFGPITIFDPETGLRTALAPASRSKLTVNAPVLLNGLRTAAIAPVGDTKGVRSEVRENLSSQMVNGVMAEGFRSTMTIPRGEIGNDREIKVVNERWFSNDLQMVIRSTNSDPRFGETTYEVTGINRQEPDASLFRVPENYTEANTAGAPGRGGGGARSGGEAGRGAAKKGGKSPYPKGK